MGIDMSTHAVEQINKFMSYLSPEHLKEVKDIVDIELQRRHRMGFIEKIPRKKSPKALASKEVRLLNDSLPWNKTSTNKVR